MMNKEILIKKVIYQTQYRSIKEMDILCKNYINSIKNEIKDYKIKQIQSLIDFFYQDDKTIMDLVFKKGQEHSKKHSTKK